MMVAGLLDRGAGARWLGSDVNSFGTHLTEAGVPLPVIQVLMGLAPA
jgi:hypothetical protein